MRIEEDGRRKRTRRELTRDFSLQTSSHFETHIYREGEREKNGRKRGKMWESCCFFLLDGDDDDSEYDCDESDGCCKLNTLFDPSDKMFTFLINSFCCWFFFFHYCIPSCELLFSLSLSFQTCETDVLLGTINRRSTLGLSLSLSLFLLIFTTSLNWMVARDGIKLMDF